VHSHVQDWLSHLLLVEPHHVQYDYLSCCPTSLAIQQEVEVLQHLQSVANVLAVKFQHKHCQYLINQISQHSHSAHAINGPSFYLFRQGKSPGGEPLDQLVTEPQLQSHSKM
jgi:hypothetical protein